ncbi:hypothetical protein SBA5_1040007 [Candidatus Sulfotelmatomonas gaucii]|uniref:Uncharacterized protein n=1 Tax=Candidatus Sulfuritelmatomonas gaucii TaxID=2043161 RepID=A0A2N9L2M9_9BACT|nr:hypothetical protein SBA5_1040007 [Candidatus Sulfotelmatomonas gaucii]
MAATTLSGGLGGRSVRLEGAYQAASWGFNSLLAATRQPEGYFLRCKLLRRLEARAGIEPAHKGFADLSLTTWVPRLGLSASPVADRPIPHSA